MKTNVAVACVVIFLFDLVTTDYSRRVIWKVLYTY